MQNNDNRIYCYGETDIIHSPYKESLEAFEMHCRQAEKYDCAGRNLFPHAVIIRTALEQAAILAEEDVTTREDVAGEPLHSSSATTTMKRNDLEKIRLSMIEVFGWNWLEEIESPENVKKDHLDAIAILEAAMGDK